jgi:DNA ligase-1
MILPKLYERSSTGKTTEWAIEVEGNKFRTISGFIDGKRVTSAWTLCEGKNLGKANATTPEEQALAEATATHRKRKEHGAFENINDIDNETFFEPMLANKLSKRINKLKFPVYSNMKLDGVRCIIKGDGMWTREGKQLISAPHIFEDLKAFFEKDPNLILDGELYCDKLANDFNKIISLVRKKKPTAEELAESKEVIQYHVYDLPSSKENYYKRYIELTKLGLPKSSVIVHAIEVNSLEEIKALYEKYVEQGYEGQMIRLDLPYENKRSNSLLKDKEYDDTEFVILGVEEGKGNMSGKVGKVYFKAANGKPFDSPINGDWEYLAKLLKENKLIGKKATVRHFKLTPGGIPRFPKVIAIRDYE